MGRRVGDRIDALLQKYTGGSCNCPVWDEFLQQLNEWGREGCRKRFKEILQRFRQEGESRQWAPKLQVAVPEEKGVYRAILELAINGNCRRHV